LATGIPARLTPSEGRRFGFTIGLAFAVFAAIAWWRDHTVVWKVLGVVSGLLLLSGAAIPTMMGPVLRTWMAFAHALSRVTTPLFMGIVYFLVLTPIALFIRAIGHRPLKREPRNGGFWVPVATGSRTDMKRQF
jgi:hypothetical protein